MPRAGFPCSNFAESASDEFVKGARPINVIPGRARLAGPGIHTPIGVMDSLIRQLHIELSLCGPE